jgi:hypothetical protein
MEQFAHARVVILGTPRDTDMRTHVADECRAKALHCAEVAEHAYALDDRAGFLAFAEAWYKLANEIDHSERLIAFIDSLGTGDSVKESKAPGETDSGVGSLRRLTAAILTLSSCLVANQLAQDAFEGDF